MVITGWVANSYIVLLKNLYYCGREMAEVGFSGRNTWKNYQLQQYWRGEKMLTIICKSQITVLIEILKRRGYACQVAKKCKILQFSVEIEDFTKSKILMWQGIRGQRLETFQNHKGSIRTEKEYSFHDCYVLLKSAMNRVTPKGPAAELFETKNVKEYMVVSTPTKEH